MVRQGDVLLVPVRAVPKRSEPVGRERGQLILALGEATGHAHVVESASAELVSADDAHELYLLVHGPEPVTLEHEEHDPIPLERGVYQVVRQREYEPSPRGSRFVLD